MTTLLCGVRRWLGPWIVLLAVAIVGACGRDAKPVVKSVRPSQDDAETSPAHESNRSKDLGAHLASGPAPWAYDEARLLGKPLLAIVVPTDARLRRFHGEVAGAVLARSDVLLSLALAHVECLSESEIERLAPGTTQPTIPMAVVVETDGEGRPASTIAMPMLDPEKRDGFLRELSGAWDLLAREWTESSEEDEDTATRRRGFPPISQGAKSLIDAPRRVLRGEMGALRRRAAAARVALGDVTADAYERSVREGIPLDPETADRAAAIVLLAAETWPRMRTTAEARVLVGAIRRLSDRAPSGGQWLPFPPAQDDTTELDRGDSPLPAAGVHSQDWCGTGRMGEDRVLDVMRPSAPFLQFVRREE